MEIKQIKDQLSITELLHHYGLKVIKKHIHCPFHDDKTPSMQVYPDTNTVYCFSGNCSKSGNPIDIIDFIMHKESITKHQAILKAKTMIAPTTANAILKLNLQEAKMLGKVINNLTSHLEQKITLSKQNILKEEAYFDEDEEENETF